MIKITTVYKSECDGDNVHCHPCLDDRFCSLSPMFSQLLKIQCVQRCYAKKKLARDLVIFFLILGTVLKLCRHI